jgi:hypothetical protein
LKFLDQAGDLRFYHIPNDFMIQPKIFVRNHVSQTGNLAPGDFGMRRFNPSRHLSRGFADHLQTVHNRQKCAAVFSKFLSAGQLTCEIKDFAAGLLNVFNV